jgi:hypothetical protein
LREPFLKSRVSLSVASSLQSASVCARLAKSQCFLFLCGDKRGGKRKEKIRKKYTKQQGKALILKFYRAINQSIKDHRISTMLLLLPKRVP